MNDAAPKLTVKDMMEHPQIKGRMIQGTSKNLGPSYLVFARKGAMGLSLRIEGLVNGSLHGKTGTMYLPVRIRSSSVEKMFAEEDAKNGLSHFPMTPVKAWPNIEFATIRDESSASTVIGKFIKGTLTTDPELLQRELAGKKLAKEIVAYLQQLAGIENFIMHHRVLQDYLQASYTEYFTGIEEKYGIFKGMKEAAEAEDVGVFANMAAKMKKKHDELVKQHQSTPVEDNDVLDDDDMDDEDSGD
jgi:hypothetical protein